MKNALLRLTDSDYPTGACVVFLVVFSVSFSVAFVDSDSVVASVVDSVVVVVVRNELESASRAVNDLVMEPPPCIGQTGSEELRE